MVGDYERQTSIRSVSEREAQRAPHHSQSNVYAHIQDKNRSLLTKKLGKEFYVGNLSDGNSQGAFELSPNSLSDEEAKIDMTAIAEFLNGVKEKDPLLHKKVLAALVARND